MRALFPSTSRRTDIPEADMSPRKRACLTTPAPGFEIRESSAAGAARQPGPTEYDLRRCRVEHAGYEINDTWDEIVDKLMEIAPTTLEGVNERVTKLDTTVRQRTDEFEIHFEDAQYDRALLRARVNTLFRDRPDNRRTTMLMDREAIIDYPDYVTADPVDYGTWTHQDRSRNGDNNNDSVIGGRRQMTTPRECSYTDFLKCQPMSFQGTERVVGLTRWKCLDMVELLHEGCWTGCCLCNAIDIFEKNDHIQVLPKGSAPTVERLAIGPVTVKADLLLLLLPTTTTTTRGPKGKMQGVSLALNVEFKDTTRVSAQSSRMVTKGIELEMEMLWQERML
nr:hypothetical protein [Tanacetum cinerariifolium]